MLSIVIPTLNEEKYLPVLLEEIKKQNFSDYEIIVADAGSKDKTVEIAKSFGCIIVKGGLPAKGRNEGAKVAKGGLLLFLDADVELSEQSLPKLLNEFVQRNLDVATCFLIPKKKNLVIASAYNIFHNWPILLLERVSPFASDFILIKKTIHQKINGFDEEIKFGEDKDYVKRASCYGKFAILRSSKMVVSTRRFQQDGWIRGGLRYLAYGFLMLIHVPLKSNWVKYKFNHYSEKIKD